MGKRPAEDVLPNLEATRRSLPRLPRQPRQSPIDGSSAPRVASGSIDAAAASVVFEAVVPLVTESELLSITAELEQARERVRQVRAEHELTRAALSTLQTQHEDSLVHAAAAASARELATVASYDDAMRDLAELRTVVAALQEQRGHDSAALESAQGRLLLSQRAVSELTEKLSTTFAEAKTACSQRDALQSILSKERQDFEALRCQIERAAQENVQLRSQAASGAALLLGSNDSVVAELAAEREASHELAVALAEARSELATLWSHASEVEGRLAHEGGIKETLEGRVETLVNQVSHLAHERDHERDVAAAREADLRAQLEDVQGQVAARESSPDQSTSDPVLLAEAEAKLAAALQRRRDDLARLEASGRQLEQLRNALADSEQSRRTVIQRAGEQRTVLDRLRSENDALAGLVSAARQVCQLPGSTPDLLVGLVPATFDKLTSELTEVQGRLATQVERVKELEIRLARAARVDVSNKAGVPSAVPSSMGESVLAKLRTITADMPV